MRKVYAGLFILLESVVESANKWQFDHFDEEAIAALCTHRQEDSILLGRVTYQEWAN